PAVATGDRGTQVLVLAFGQVTPPDQLTGLGDVFDEVDVVHAAIDVLHFAHAVVDPHEAALARVHDVFLAVFFHHHEFAHGGVEVPRVVRNFLMVGLQVTVVGVEQQHRGGVQVGARTRPFGLPFVAGPVVQRRRVAGAPPHGVGVRIVAACHPAAATAGLPRVVAPGVALVGGRTFVATYGQELPDLL